MYGANRVEINLIQEDTYVGMRSFERCCLTITIKRSLSLQNCIFFVFSCIDESSTRYFEQTTQTRRLEGREMQKEYKEVGFVLMLCCCNAFNLNIMIYNLH